MNTRALNPKHCIYFLWAVVALVAVLSATYTLNRLLQPRFEAQLEAQLAALPADWAAEPHWRSPLTTPPPHGQARNIYHVQLEPSTSRKASDLKVLRNHRVSQSLDGFGAFDCTDFDDHYLSFLTSATKLRGLDLSGTTVSDAGAEIIAEHFPHLVLLDVSRTTITQAGVETILAAKQLPMIDVSGLSVDKKSLKAFARVHSPSSIIMLDGKDIMDQPDSVYQILPWP